RSAQVKDPSVYTVVGQPVARLDLPDKFTGRFQFVSDIVLPGMLHGRVVRVNYDGATWTSKPKNATFQSVDDSMARAIPPFVQTVQTGNFVGVGATDEWAAIQAAKALRVRWSNDAPLVSDSNWMHLQTALTNPAALTNGGNVYASTTQEVVKDGLGHDGDAAYAAATGVKLTQTYYS